MLLTDIPRLKAGATSTISEVSALGTERSKLATRAADLLGYRALADNLAGKTIATCEGKLTEALRGLDIDVLDSSAVIKYQLAEASRLTAAKISEDFQSWSVGNPIPEFVLDKAIRIKERIPEVVFHVHYINEPKADPFLIAQLGKEIYYVEAWDEPRFESQL